MSTASAEQLAAAENQRARLEAAGIERLLGDVGSGLDLHRPGYLQLLDLIDQRLVSEVIVTRIDRLCRDAAASDAVLVTAARRGVTIRALDGGTVDAESPHGFLLSRIATSLAEVESRQLSLRVRRGLEAGRQANKPVRGRAPWGYQLLPDRSGFALDPVTAPKARALLDLMAGHGWRFYSTLRDLQPDWAAPFRHPTSLRAWVSNPVLRGGIGYHLSTRRGGYADVRWGCHPALMTHLEYDELERTLALNRNLWGRNEKATPHMLRGLVVCAKCGYRMNYHSQYLSLFCRRMECENRWKCCKEATIVAAVKQALSAAAERLPTSNAPTPEQLQLMEQIRQLETLADPDLEDALERKRRRLAYLQHSRPVDAERLAALRDVRVWDMATEEEFRRLLVLFVDRVVVDRADVEEVVLRV